MNRYKTGGPSKATPTTLCQKCLKRGHYSYECTASKQDRPYVSRPSRSQQFLNPKLAPKLEATAPEPKPQMKKLENEVKAPKSPKRGREDQDDRPDAKRRRSVSSYSSDSVSTISTNRSRSRSRSPPTRSRIDKQKKPERRVSKDRAPRNDRRRESSAGRHRRPSGSSWIASRDGDPSERSYAHRDASPPRKPRDRSFSPPPRRKSPARRQSRSRSPYRGPRDGGRESRVRRESGAAPSRPTAPRERSLSAYSQRVAMTKAMGGS